jgi:hypothetical protein
MTACRLPQHRSTGSDRRPPWQPASGLDTEAPIPSTDHRGSPLQVSAPKRRSHPPTTVAVGLRAKGRNLVRVCSRRSRPLPSSAPKRSPLPPATVVSRFRAQRRNAHLFHRPPNDRACFSSTEAPNPQTSRSTTLAFGSCGRNRSPSSEHRLAMPGCSSAQALGDTLRNTSLAPTSKPPKQPDHVASTEFVKSPDTPSPTGFDTVRGSALLPPGV